MFYLYLVILSLAEIYFFNSIKSIISGGQVILGDLLFSMVCVGLALFMVLGALHVKHLNKDWLKKFGLGVIAIGALILSGSILSFNFNWFLTGLEYSIILAEAGYLIYYYQTVPEGEPDAEIDESEITESEPFYYPRDYSSDFGGQQDYMGYGMESYGGDDFYEDNVTQPEIAQLKQIINDILEINDLEENLKDKVNKVLTNVNNVDTANSEYKLENINSIQIIMQKLLDSIIIGEDANDTTHLILDSFDTINKNLENIYYNTRGAQVFRVERDVNELASQLSNSSSD